MSRFDRQRKLFANDGPSWRSLSPQQQQRVVELLAELLVEYLERGEPIVQQESHELEEDHNA